VTTAASEVCQRKEATQKIYNADAFCGGSSMRAGDGLAAFVTEAINQLAEEYIQRKEHRY